MPETGEGVPIFLEIAVKSGNPGEKLGTPTSTGCLKLESGG